MNSVMAIVIAVVVAILGYRLYAKRVDRNIIQSDPNKPTPARMYMDGVDFYPTSKNILFGYHSKSIMAVGPVVGAILAVQWGWLPVLLYFLFGVCFFGWVQDYASTMIAVRNEGQTFAGLGFRLISPRSRTLLFAFIYFYLWLGFGAFAQIIARMMSNPRVPLAIGILTLMGILVGQMITRWRVDIIKTTVLSIVVIFVGIWLSTRVPVQNMFLSVSGTAGGKASPIMFGDVTQSLFIWTIVVLVFCYFGATLPIWRWAQPINFIAFWIIFIGMIGTIIGIFIWHPSFAQFPAYTGFKTGLGALWPVMFVTIACGAISGWHSLVGSTGTSRQIERETDVLPVAGGSMFLEMIMGVLSLIIAVAAVGGFGGYKALLAKGPGAVFAHGMGAFLSKLGFISPEFGVAFGGVFFVILAITVMQLGLRFMRVAWGEFVGDRIPVMRNPHIATLVSVVLLLVMAWTSPLARLWVLAGAANQLMAGLALILICTWLISANKKATFAFIPMVFMVITTISAIVYTSYRLLYAVATTADMAPGKMIGNIVAGIIGAVLIILALFLVADATKAIGGYRERAREAPTPGLAGGAGS